MGQFVVVRRKEDVVAPDVSHDVEVEGDGDEEVDLPGQAEAHVPRHEGGDQRQEEGDARRKAEEVLACREAVGYGEEDKRLDEVGEVDSA